MTGDDEVAIGHLQRRKIEGRVLIPLIEACREKFGDAAARDLVTATIRKLAAEDGSRWAETYGSDMASLRNVAENVWAGGGSLNVDVIGQTEDTLDFNVTRCRYAEFYKDLGLSDVGYLVHCNRDHAMVDGFNPQVALCPATIILSGRVASSSLSRYTR